MTHIFSQKTQVISTIRPQLSNLDPLDQSQQWANPQPLSRETLPSSSSDLQISMVNSSILEEIQSLDRRFEFLSSKLQEQDQTLDQIKSDIGRLYMDKFEHRQFQGGVPETIRSQSEEISTLRAENGPAIHAIWETVKELKS